MATTPNLGIPYPAATDAPDGPGAIYNIASWLDARGGDATFLYAGTCKNYGAPWITKVRSFGRLGVLVLNVDPGANGLSASSSNNLIGSLPAGFGPLVPVMAHATIGLNTGNRATIAISSTDNSVKVDWTSVTIASGAFLTAFAVYPLA